MDVSVAVEGGRGWSVTSPSNIPWLVSGKK